MRYPIAFLRRCLDCRAVVRIGHHAEHYLLVGYAAIEVAGRASLIWYCSVGLVFTGVCGLIYEIFLEESK